MKKNNLLSREEMRNVKGGDMEIIGCYVVCQETGDHAMNGGVPFGILTPDCSPESQAVCTFGTHMHVVRCFCTSGTPDIPIA